MMTDRDDYSPGERAILRELRALGRFLRKEDAKMDAAGEALEAKINELDADVKADNEAVVKGGEAVAGAGAKFAELDARIKELVEKGQAAGALTDTEAEQLTTIAGEVGTHLGTATTELDAHFETLAADTAGA